MRSTTAIIGVDPRKLGALLREHRVDRGLSLRAATEATGLHHATTSAIERGRALPSLEAFLSLAVAYEIDLNTFLRKGVTPGPREPRGRRFRKRK